MTLSYHLRHMFVNINSNSSHAAFRIRPADVKDILSEVMLRKGTPEYLRSDNGSEFIAKVLGQWLSEMDAAPMYIMPGSPWENGFVESFNGTMANELLNREIFDTLFILLQTLSGIELGIIVNTKLI